MLHIIIAYVLVVTLLNILEPDINLVFIVTSLILVNFFDAHSTWLCSKTGKGEEGNPIFKWSFRKIGVLPSLIFIKTTFTALLLYVVYIDRSFKNPILACSIIIGFVTINNYRIATSNRDKSSPPNPLSEK